MARLGLSHLEALLKVSLSCVCLFCINERKTAVSLPVCINEPYGMRLRSNGMVGKSNSLPSHYTEPISSGFARSSILYLLKARQRALPRFPSMISSLRYVSEV